MGDFTSLFVGRSVGSLVGVLLAGKIVDKFDAMVLIGIAILTNGVIFFTLGLVKSIWLLTFLISASGFCMGTLNTSGNVFLLHLWRRDGEKAKQNSVLQARV